MIVLMSFTVVTPRALAGRYKRCVGIYCFNLQCASTFSLEDGGSTFIRNVGFYLHGVTAQNTNIFKAVITSTLIFQ
jgi:hypothetical protein